MSESSLQREYGEHLVDEVRAGRMTRADLVRRATVIGLSLPSISALIAAAGGDAAAATVKGAATLGKRGGTMRVSMITPPAVLDPVTFFDTGSIGVAQMVGEYLSWVELDNSLRPVLAESWRPDARAKTWTFKLRKDVRFSDGRPMRAEDVVATFERLVKAGDSDFTGILSKGNVEKIDAQTVAFHLDRPFVDFPVLVSVANYNAIILPADYPGHFEKNAIGTGPFVLTKVVPKQSASFKRNPNYWRKGLPLLDGVEYRFFDENQPQVLALQAGDIDMMLETPFQGSQALFSDPSVTILSARSSAYRELHMRADTTPFTDKRVRQALAYSLDRKKLVEALFRGKADVGNDHMFAPVFAISPRIPQRKQDYAKAKRLLSEAGHSNGVSVTLTTENYLEIPQYVTIVREMAKPAGIDIKLNVESQATYYGSAKNQPWLAVPMGVVDWASRPVPSQFINLAFTCKGIWNSAHWCNKEFDRLGKQFDATLDESSRRKIAKKMALIQQDETPAIVAYWIQTPRAVSKKVRGVKPDGAAFLDLTKASFA